MHITYYQNLSYYLLSLQSRLSSLSLSYEEQSLLSQTISHIYDLTILQIQELQQHEG